MMTAMPSLILSGLGAVLCCILACGPVVPDGPNVSTSTGSDGSPSTEQPTSTLAPTSTEPTTITGGAGCPDAPDPAATDECASHTDAATCAAPCRWFTSKLFPDCGGACSEAIVSGVCVSMYGAPETGCTGPCAKFWQQTPAGLQQFEAEFCFEFPDGWAWCQLDGRAECECGCVTPP